MDTRTKKMVFMVIYVKKELIQFSDVLGIKAEN